MTTKLCTNLPDTIFCIIIEYLDWYEVARFDNVLSNRNARNRYLDALKIRQLKVERNRFWSQAVDKGILNWLISRNISVICWNLSVDNTQLMTIANGCPQLRSLNITCSGNITDEGIRALASGCPQLQSLNIRSCGNITDEGIRAVATGCTQLQSLDISNCRNITDAGIRALATRCQITKTLNLLDR